MSGDLWRMNGIDSLAGLQVHLYGGDIMLTPEQQATLEATSNLNDPFSPQNAVVHNEQSLWSNGVIYYIFDNSLSKRVLHSVQLWRLA